MPACLPSSGLLGPQGWIFLSDLLTLLLQGNLCEEPLQDSAAPAEYGGETGASPDTDNVVLKVVLTRVGHLLVAWRDFGADGTLLALGAADLWVMG